MVNEILLMMLPRMTQVYTHVCTNSSVYEEYCYMCEIG